MNNFTQLLKKSFFKVLFLILFTGSAYAQPSVLYTGLTSTTPSPFNSRFDLVDKGVFKQIRFQANQSASSGSLGWAFHSGASGSPNYSPCWRPFTGGNTLGANGFIPTSYANGAKYNSSGGGSDGLLPAITNGNYYTFNVMKNGSADSNMALLETNYNPVSLVSQSVVLPLSATGTGTVSLVASAAPSSGEYVYMRYSLDGWATSNYIAMTFTGSTGAAYIPCDPSPGSPVQYYFFSSNKTKAQIDADVTSFGTQNVFDMYTLNLLNNSGSNYSYTQPSTTGFTGVYNVPGSCYPTLASFITALNGGTVTGPVTVKVAAGYTETAPTGGYSITQTGTSANTITFVKDGTGANPTFTAPLWTAGGLSDVIMKIVGGDYITIDGFTLQENPSNTVTATGTTNTMTEVGFGLYLASGTNGAQNNTIQNCTITLNSNFPNSFGIFSTSSSLASAPNTAAAATSVAGTNSNNKIYSNTISNVAYGIYVLCEPITSTINETGWDIGGSSAATGNTITFGNANATTVAWYRFSTSTMAGIAFRNGGAVNVRYNTVTSNSLAYSQSAYGGILISAGTAPTTTYTTTISNNTVNLNNTGIVKAFAIDFAYGTASATFVANNNVISYVNNSTTTATDFQGIKANYTSANSTINGNTITLNQSGSATYSGPNYFINADGATTNLTIQNNTLQTTGGNIKSTGDTWGISHSGIVSGALNIGGSALTANTINITRTGISGSVYGVYSGAGSLTAVTAYNVGYNNITIAGLTGTTIAYGIRNTDGVGAINKSFFNNTINISGTNSGITTGLFFNYGNINASNNAVTLSTGATTMTGLDFSLTNLTSGTANANTITLTSTGVAAVVRGIYTSATVVTNGFTITNNTINSISASATSGNITIQGISVKVGASNTISGNTIKDFSTGIGTGISNVGGIVIAGGATPSIFGNNINNISSSCSGATSTLSGIVFQAGATTSNIYNNFISDLKAPYTIANTGVIGIACYSAASTYRVYYNTIKIGTTATPISGGANFGAAGVALQGNLATIVLDLRNNIINLNVTSSGTGFSSCVATGAGVANSIPLGFASTSNNNLYSINSGANNYLFVQGTSASSLVNGYALSGLTPNTTNNINNDVNFNATCGLYKTFMGGTREAATYVEDNLVAGTPVGTFAPSGTSFAENTAQTISTPSITTDFNGASRATTNDIGALQFSGTTAVYTAPSLPASVVVSSPLTSICPGDSLTFTATPTNGGTAPAYQWKINGLVVSGQTASTFTTTTLVNNDVVTVMMTSNLNCVTSSPTTSSGITITVKTPVSITSATAAASPICSTATTTLTANGVVGDGATVTWYSATGGTGTNYGTGLTLANAAPGTYYARVTGDCGLPVEVSVIVGTKVNVAITSVTATTNPICSSATTTLTANGVVGDGATVNWYTTSGGTGTSLGSGTTLVAGPGSYYAYVTGDCGTPAEATITVTIDNSKWIGGTGNWNVAANWSCNAIPTITTPVIINSGAVTVPADAEAASITMTSTATLTVSTGYDLTIDGVLDVASTAAVTIENNANVLQNGTSNNNVGTTVSVKRNSSPLFLLDYTMWSSPVSGTQTLANFSPLTATNRFYTYNEGTNAYVGNNGSGTFTTAKGYLIRMPTTSSATVATSYEGIFTGKPNSGNISYAMDYTAGGYNAVGNPYPSTLSVDSFIADNSSNIEGTLWFWRKTNNASNPNFYCTLTVAGSTLVNSHTYADADYISPGQGFIVKAKSATNVNFTNSMRAGSNTNEFFRAASRNRFWLELKNAANVSYGQKLVAYLPNTTTGYDNGYDGLFIGDSQTALLSVVEGRELVIQARPVFNADDIVPLLFKTNVAGTYSVSLSQLEGIFNNGQDILLRDNLTGTVHNLSASGAYSFSTEVGSYASRFEILYQNALSTASFNENSVVVYNNNHNIHINSGRVAMDKVKVFDVRGRLIIEKSKVNSSEIVIDGSRIANQVLLLQITSTEGTVVTKKIVN